MNSKYGYNVLKGGEEPPLGSHKKLSDEDIVIIQQLLIDNNTDLESIYNKYNKISKSQITRINNGKAWYNSNLDYPLRAPENLIGKELANQIINDLKYTKLSQKEIGKKYQVSRTCITAINLGKVHTYLQKDEIYPIRCNKMTDTPIDYDETIIHIIEDLKRNDLTGREISKKYNVSEFIISSINVGRTKKYILYSENYPIRKHRIKNK